MKKIISTLLVLCLAFSCATAMAESKWTNASDWAKPELEKAVSSGVYPTALENKDLTQNITRAEQAALTVKIYEVVTGSEAPSGDNPFTDTNDTEIIKAFKLGITSGTTATTFSPDENLTREQAAAMLERVFRKIKNTETLSFEMPSQFADHSSISDYAIESVYFMNAQGYIKGTEAGFEPKGLCTREQALAIAQRMANNLKGEQKPSQSEKEEFTIACIGGSLTQGGSTWQAMIRNYFAKQMPDKDIKIINAGIGGTTSSYGAKRFAKDVLAFNPDMVIIEFAVNDSSWGINGAESLHQVHMESMLYQCAKAEKVPAVMFLYANFNYDDNSDDKKAALYSIEAKEKLAKYYNIPSVNAYEYGLSLYNVDKEKTSTSYKQWLEQEKKYYPVGNIHPNPSGYKIYGEAIIEAFDKNGLDFYLKPVEEKTALFCQNEKSTIMSRYEYKFVTDSSLEYNGKWFICNQENPMTTLMNAVPVSFYKEPYYPTGVAYTMTANSEITFKTDATEIYISYISGQGTNEIAVLIDGKEVSNIATSSTYEDVNNLSSAIKGTSGKTVTLKAKNNAPLRICAIIEKVN